MHQKFVQDCCTPPTANLVFLRQECQKAPIPPAECFNCLLPIKVNPPICQFIFACSTKENQCNRCWFDDGVRCIAKRRGEYIDGWNNPEIRPEDVYESSYTETTYVDNMPNTRALPGNNPEASVTKSKKIQITLNKEGKIMMGSKFHASVKIHVGIEYEFTFDTSASGKAPYCLLAKTMKGIRELFTTGKTNRYNLLVDREMAKDVKEIICQVQGSPSTSVRLVIV